MAAMVIPDLLSYPMLLGVEKAISDSGSPGQVQYHYFVNDIVPTSLTGLADFVEAGSPDWPAYASQTGAWNEEPFRCQSGGWSDLAFELGASLEVAPPIVPVTVYGVYATDLAGATLLYSVRFATPLVIGTESNPLSACVDGFLQYDGIGLLQQSGKVAFPFFPLPVLGFSVPQGVSAMYVVPDVLMGSILTDILSAVGTTSTGVVDVHLFTNNIVPTKTNVLADFTELTNVEVPGYVKKTANWFAGVPHRLNSGAWEGPNSLADPTFVCSGSAPPSPQIVYGFFLTDSTDAILLGSGVFSVPYTFTQIGDGFTLPGNPELMQTNGSQLVLSLQDLEPN